MTVLVLLSTRRIQSSVTGPCYGVIAAATVHVGSEGQTSRHPPS